MRVRIEVLGSGEKGLHEMEVLLINGGHETVMAELSEVKHEVELDIGHPEAIVVRPVQE